MGRLYLTDQDVQGLYIFPPFLLIFFREVFMAEVIREEEVDGCVCVLVRERGGTGRGEIFGLCLHNLVMCK